MTEEKDTVRKIKVTGERNTTSKNNVAEIQNSTKTLEKDFTCNIKKRKKEKNQENYTISVNAIDYLNNRGSQKFHRNVEYDISHRKGPPSCQHNGWKEDIGKLKNPGNRGKII